ncbi:hypothetical protein CHLRE_16g652483v5 [Chlamydomonas reinhardtii]|uniref:Uncharacterized protein n=1 Tax=Chlamydomonas reinhardtii TaxID=3055 RepID=A0A2K3CSY3_CHLRE|nr:uncharacterized protein CHLRE_16g652483v5 [Chlamydomonas reinhardtii]PNW71395.1 hypothetical protein CHLRE_16g652483v5 [Chlamydomonas reinhardtii]
MASGDHTKGLYWPSSAEDSASRPQAAASCEAPSDSGGRSLARHSPKRSSHGWAVSSDSASPALPAFARTSTDSQETFNSRPDTCIDQPTNASGGGGAQRAALTSWSQSWSDGSWPLSKAHAWSTLSSLSRAELLVVNDELNALESSIRRELARTKADFAQHVNRPRPGPAEASSPVSATPVQLQRARLCNELRPSQACASVGRGPRSGGRTDGCAAVGYGAGSTHRAAANGSGGPPGPQQQRQPASHPAPATAPATTPSASIPHDGGLGAGGGSYLHIQPAAGGVITAITKEHVHAVCAAIGSYPHPPPPQRAQQLARCTRPSQRSSEPAMPPATPRALMPPPPPPPMHQRLPAPTLGVDAGRGSSAVSAAAAAAADTLRQNATWRQAAPLPPRPVPAAAASGRRGATVTRSAVDWVALGRAVGRRPMQPSDAMSMPSPPQRPPPPSSLLLPPARAGAVAPPAAVTMVPLSGAKRDAAAMTAELAWGGVKAAPQARQQQPAASPPRALQRQQPHSLPQPLRPQPQQPQQPQHVCSPQAAEGAAALAAIMMLLRRTQQQQQQKDPAQKRQRLMQ